MASSLVIAAAAMTGIRPEAVYAVEGWTRDSGQWMYLNRKDEPVTNRWEKAREDLFYLGSNGIMVQDGFIGQGAGLYYVDQDGKRVVSAWVQNKKDDGLGHPPGWYYFGADGRAYHRNSSQFMKIIDGKAYAFDENGLMLTGWLDREGKRLNEDGNPLETGDYYASGDGALKTGGWLDYSSLDVWNTEGLTSSVTGRDYSGYDKIWLYFDNHSRKVKTTTGQLKQKEINGNTYGFDEYGIMLPWWSKVGTVSNADKSNPTTDVSPRFYSGYDGGRLLKNRWVWMYPSEDLLENDFNDHEYSWWHTDDKGKVYQNGIRSINGSHYAFDGIGRMQTGFTLFDGRGTFVAQYDPGTWSSDDFKYGNIYGDEKADLYFFSPDELNDGSMRTGEDIRIELSDGIHTFGFGSNGLALGNRNKTQRKNDRFYRGGLLLEADEEYGYGIVQLPVIRSGETNKYEYRLVNTNGKVINGKKKIVKDQDGGWIIILNNRFAARVADEEKPKWYNGPEGPGFYHYDRHEKGNEYGGLIAGYGNIPAGDFEEEAAFHNLPPEEMLNFGH